MTDEIIGMNKEICKYFHDNGYTEPALSNTDFIKKLYNLILKNISIDPINNYECYYYGEYYAISKQPALAKKYLLKAIEYKSDDFVAIDRLVLLLLDDARLDDMEIIRLCWNGFRHGNKLYQGRMLCHMGTYYTKKREDSSSVLYLKLAVDIGCVDAMYVLGMYYRRNSFAVDNSEHYFKMAADLGHEESFNILYNRYVGERAYDKVKTYGLSLIEKKLTNSVALLIKYSIEKNDMKLFADVYQKNPDNLNDGKLTNYFLKGIIHFNVSSETIDIVERIDLGLCTEKVPFWLSVLKKTMKEKVDAMELHFKYSMEGKGFEDAKKDFYDRVTS